MLEWAAHTSGEVSGEVKNFQNFTFLKVHDAGHMVPTDQPESALDMIMEFIYTKKITGKPIPIPEVDPMPEDGPKIEQVEWWAISILKMLMNEKYFTKIYFLSKS